MKQFHSLLKKQIKNHLTDINKISEEFNNFLNYVSDAYNSFDDDKKMLERSLELSSEELLKLVSRKSALYDA